MELRSVDWDQGVAAEGRDKTPPSAFLGASRVATALQDGGQKRPWNTHRKGQIPAGPLFPLPEARSRLEWKSSSPGGGGLGDFLAPGSPPPTPRHLWPGPQAAAGRKVPVLPPPGAFGEYNPRPAGLSLRLGGQGSGGWGFRRADQLLLFLFLHAIMESFKHKQKQ